MQRPSSRSPWPASITRSSYIWSPVVSPLGHSRLQIQLWRKPYRHLPDRRLKNLISITICVLLQSLQQNQVPGAEYDFRGRRA
jgi:hypothetical protein